VREFFQRSVALGYSRLGLFARQDGTVKIRNPKLEVRNKPQQSNQNPKIEIRNEFVWNFVLFDHLDLFRISDFEF
jgi:hypothetical protein